MANDIERFPMWLRLLMVAAVLLVVTSITHTIVTVATCDGTAVRGLLWMECLEEADRG